jgi:hypothetical protein
MSRLRSDAMSDRLPMIVHEYASDSQLSIEVAREHFELYFNSDENLVRQAIENHRRSVRDHRLLDHLTPSVTYDNEVLRAVGEFASPVRVGDLARVLADRWPARGAHYLTARMWSGNRIARSCQRLLDDDLVRADPVQLGAGATQIVLTYSLTDSGVDRASKVAETDPRPAEWR